MRRSELASEPVRDDRPERERSPVGASASALAHALQLRGGNAAAARHLAAHAPRGRARRSTVQRRLPSSSAAVAAVSGTSPAALANERDLKRMIKRALRELERDSPAIAAAARAAYALSGGAPPASGPVVAGGGPALPEWDALLDEGAPLPETHKPLLGRLLDALIDAHGGSGLPRYALVYPLATVRNEPPVPGSQEEANLRALVGRASSLMRAIASGAHDAAVRHVFIDAAAVGTARATFAAAADALERLHANRAISIDVRHDLTASHAGGKTNPMAMLLSPDAFSAVNDANVVKLIHESMHAAAPAIVDYLYGDDVAGSPFHTARSWYKLHNAAHFEEVARMVLGFKRSQPWVPFVAGGPPSSGPPSPLQRARHFVTKYVTGAWVVALHASTLLLNEARSQQRGKPSHAQPVLNLSKVLGLSLHLRGPASGAAPPIDEFDLALAESRAEHVGGLISLMPELEPAADELPEAHLGLPPEIAERLGADVAILAARLLAYALERNGYVRADPRKEAAMVLALGGAYEGERAWELAKALPRPFDRLLDGPP